MNLICDVTFPICCGYQNSHDLNEEIKNPLNLSETNCEATFKLNGSSHFSIITDLLTKKKQLLAVLFRKR